jgi:dipeptidase E
MRLLLLSNSANHGRGYLDHAVEEVRAFLGEIRRLTFVPFALHDHAAYGAKVAGRLRPLGIEVETLMDDDRARDVITGSDALFVGGGNTFRLLDRLHRKGLVEAIRDRVGSGAPYMGASAGTVISSPTMKTTNDMPIVQPPSFQALGLVRFQINPHYLDPDPASTHMGETRETRLAEFLEENETPVLGLREGSWLSVAEESVTLGGDRPARLFRRESDPEEVPAGSDLTFLNRA